MDCWDAVDNQVMWRCRGDLSLQRKLELRMSIKRTKFFGNDIRLDWYALQGGIGTTDNQKVLVSSAKSAGFRDDKR